MTREEMIDEAVRAALELYYGIGGRSAVRKSIRKIDQDGITALRRRWEFRNCVYAEFAEIAAREAA